MWSTIRLGIQPTKTSILVIPHQPHRNIKVRALEMAYFLAKNETHDVHVLTWDPGYPASGFIRKLIERGGEMYQSTRLPLTFEKDGALTRIRMPHLLAPYPVCQWYNKAQLRRLFNSRPFDVVINASAYHFPLPENFRGRYLYDVVDDHLSPQAGPHWRRTRTFTLRELRKADTIISVGHALQDILSREGFADTCLIPNGVDIQTSQSVPDHAVASVRKQWDCEDRFTIGYIGNHGAWAGLDFLLDAFRQFNRAFPQSRLLIVGPVEAFERYRQAYPDEAIRFTGPIPPKDVAAYFQACDLGVLPSPPSPFRNRAMPLKILEYGAARKQVIASPLQELETLKFPHVQCVPLEADAWITAFQAAALQWRQSGHITWLNGWDRIIAAYDWPVVWRPLEAILSTTNRDAPDETPV